MRVRIEWSGKFFSLSRLSSSQTCSHWRRWLVDGWWGTHFSCPSNASLPKRSSVQLFFLHLLLQRCSCIGEGISPPIEPQIEVYFCFVSSTLSISSQMEKIHGSGIRYISRATPRSQLFFQFFFSWKECQRNLCRKIIQICQVKTGKTGVQSRHQAEDHPEPKRDALQFHRLAFQRGLFFWSPLNIILCLLVDSVS